MKTITSTILGMILALNLSSAEPIAHIDNIAVDASKSKVEWFATKVTGAHNGDIQIKSGNFLVDHGTITGGTFVLDMTSINSTDMQGEYKDKLDVHLKSADFFDVAKFPEATLNMKKIEKSDAGFNITADLTIKGITNEITFLSRLKVDASGVSAYAEFTIDRSKWEVKYGSESFFEDLGDKLVHDDIKFKISVSAKK